MVMLMLVLAFVLRFLKLINCLLELTKSILIVFLGLILLLLKEIEFTLPESFLLLKFTLKVSMLSFHIVVLALPVFYLFSDTKLTLRECLIQLIIRLLKFLIFNFITLNELFLLSLQVLVLFDQNSFFSLER